MSNIVLVQVGDLEENHIRVLPLLKYMRSYYDVDPRPLVYSKKACSLFNEHGFFPEILSDYYGEQSNLAPLDFQAIFETELAINESYLKSEQGSKKVFLASKQYNACVKLLKKFPTCALAIWNGRTGAVANILRILAAKNQIPCIFLERGVVPGSVFVGREGVNGFCELASTEMFPETDG